MLKLLLRRAVMSRRSASRAISRLWHAELKACLIHAGSGLRAEHRNLNNEILKLNTDDLLYSSH